MTNCVFGRGHGGVGVGSETAGGVRNVAVSNCVCDGTDRGLRIKTGRGRGNIVENFRAHNVVMRGVADAVSISMLYAGGDARTGAPIDEGTPALRNIHLSDITASDIKRAAVIEGLPEMPVQELGLSNFVVDAAEGISCANVAGMVLDNIVINAGKGPAVSATNARGVEVHRVGSRRPAKEQPVIRFENVNDGLIQSCTVAEGTGTFLELKGTANRDVSLIANRLNRSAREIGLTDGASEAIIIKRL